MAADFEKVSEALARGRKARRVSAQNVAFSILILAVMIPLAVAGVIGEAVTVLAHEASEAVRAELYRAFGAGTPLDAAAQPLG